MSCFLIHTVVLHLLISELMSFVFEVIMEMCVDFSHLVVDFLLLFVLLTVFCILNSFFHSLLAMLICIFKL